MDNRLLLQVLRCAFIFCLYFLTFTCYLAPILIIKCWGSRTQLNSSPVQSRQNGYRVISWCNCIAIGIFLAMCFLEILPYAHEMFQSILKKTEFETNFPVTETVVVLGFILTLLLEQILITWQEQRESCLQEDTEQNQGLLEECEMQDLSDDPSGLHEETNLQNSSLPLSKCSSEDNPNVSISLSSVINHNHGHLSLLSHRGSGFSFFILAIATGLHCVFEGITLGLQTNTTKAVHLFIAIIIHECLMAAALGTNSTRLKYTFLSYLKFALFFSAAVPIGVIVGIIVEHAPGTGGEIVSAFLQSLSAGIFLHVTFQDFLPTEFSSHGDRSLKVFFLTIGFTIIAVVTYFLC